MKHYSIILGTLVASCVLFACTQKEEEIPVSSVTISQPTAEMIVGETVKLSATISPSNATDKDVIWASSKQSVATIDRSGLVTAIAEGTSNITATAGGKTGTCLITVSKKIIEVSSIELNKTELSLIEEEEFTLVATVKPEDATDKSVTWTSSDSSVAAVENGKVTAIKEGTTSITAKAGNKSVSCVVSVSKKVIAVTEVILDNTSLSMVEGDEITLTATVKPDDATDKTLTWSSSNTAIAKVDNGKVIAIKEGAATITAKAGDKSATCSVTVQKKVIAVTSITLNKTTLSLTKGQSETLVATVKPDNASDKNVTWTTTNSAVASVENGKITAVGGGSAIITAKAGDKEASCSVTVTVPVTSITLSKSTLSMVEGDEITLTATVKPDDATDKTLTWSSDKTDVATVDNNGQIKALKEGNATITAKAGDKKATCQITVSKKTIPVESISLDRYTVTLLEGESTKLIATVSPSNATDKAVSWTSSSTAIATVAQDGTVSAKQEGEATITATAGNKTAKCVVTVSKKVVPVSSITLNKTSLSLNKGQTETLIATVSPADATDKTVSWSSSDATIASVDQSGKVSAVKGGSVIITAAAGEQSATCSVTITVPVKSVTLNKTSVMLKKGEIVALSATVSPSDATDKTVSWTTSNNGVASVQQDGTVTAIKTGTDVVTASVGGKTATCAIFVSTPVESVSLDRTSVSLEESQTTTLVATISPNDADEKTINWSSSRTSIATVDDSGVVKAISVGETIITASVGGKSATCTVTVSKKVIPVTSVTISKSSLSMKKGDTATLTATVLPSDATDNTVTWSSSDATIVSVDQSGNLVARNGGNAVITATAGNKSATCIVSVTVPVSSISLSLSSATIIKGESISLQATIIPSDATENIVSWSSSNAAIAQVNQEGKVTAMGGGKARIIASAGGKTAECAITVIVPVTSIVLNQSSASLDLGETLSLTASISPADATDQSITWSSSNTSVATVVDGFVTAIGGGTSNITATAGTKTASCLITVNVVSITIKDSNLKSYLVSSYDLDGDGEISIIEAESIEDVNCPNRGISDLSGLESCLNLIYLNCSNNNITQLSLPNLPKLQTVSAYGNPVNFIDFRNDTQLKTLYLISSGKNSISGELVDLDGFGGSSLRITLGGTPLSSLSIKNSNTLSSIELTDNDQLNRLDLSQNTSLSSLDVSGLSSLTSLNVSGCSISSLDIRHNLQLTELDCSSNRISVLDLDSNEKLRILQASNNSLSTLKITNNNALEKVFVANNNISSINIRQNTGLKSLDISGNTGISILNARYNSSLETLDISQTSVSQIDLSNSTKLSFVNLLNTPYLTTVQISDSFNCPSSELWVDKKIRFERTNGSVAYYIFGSLYVDSQDIKGVIFDVSDDGLSASMVSTTSARYMWGKQERYSSYQSNREEHPCPYHSIYEKVVDMDDGRKNLEEIKKISDWTSVNLAFNWCSNFGDGMWYLPAFNEVKKMVASFEFIDYLLKYDPNLDNNRVVYMSSTHAGFTTIVGQDWIRDKGYSITWKTYVYGYEPMYGKHDDINPSTGQYIRAVKRLE